MKKFLNYLLYVLASVGFQAIYWYVTFKVITPSWLTFVTPVILLMLYFALHKEALERKYISSFMLLLTVGIIPLAIGGLGYLVYLLSPTLQAPVDNMAAEISLPAGYGFIVLCTKLIFTSVYITIFGGILWIKQVCSERRTRHSE